MLSDGRTASWKRLQVGDIVTGDCPGVGRFSGPIIRYERHIPSWRNWPVMFMVTVVFNEYGSEITVSHENIEEAYDSTRPHVWTDYKDVPFERVRI
jgi:hypothetical protein